MSIAPPPPASYKGTVIPLVGGIYSTSLGQLIVIIPVLVNVAFITLLERKILGLRQLRKGPNKVSVLGLLQPFRDAIKLFSKELLLPLMSNQKQFLVGPFMALGLVITVFIAIPFHESLFNIRIGFIFIYIVLSLNVFPIIIRGWASNSKYALIGRARAIAQTISYEVRFAVLIIFVLILSLGIRTSIILLSNNWWSNVLLFAPLAGIIFISSLAETNRTPFDFAEGESELVSGFNIEYGGVGFAIIFIAEYARILFIRCVISFMFLSGRLGLRYVYIFITRLVGAWVWARTTFPRFRYDKLMSLTWKAFLPISILILAQPILLSSL